MVESYVLHITSYSPGVFMSTVSLRYSKLSSHNFFNLSSQFIFSRPQIILVVHLRLLSDSPTTFLNGFTQSRTHK